MRAEKKLFQKEPSFVLTQ